MEFNFEAFKRKYIIDTQSKVFVGNADEIRAFITEYEETKIAIEEMSKELKIANDMIKEHKKSHRLKAKKAPYEDLDD